MILSTGVPSTEKNLTDLCRMLHNAMEIDLELLDSELNILSRYYCATPPEGIICNLDKYYHTMKKTLDQVHGIWYFYHEIPDQYVCYMDMRLEYSFGTYYVSLGPFLTQVYSDRLVTQVLQNYGFPSSFFSVCRSYYVNMRYFSDKIKDIAMIVMQVLTGKQETAALPLFSSSPKKNVRSHKVDTTYWEILQQDILNNYQMERIWRAAIQNGDDVSAIRAFRKMSAGEFLNRTPGNPQRAQKNLLITVNTLCRAAAADAGADHLRIHETSDFFANRIERTHNALEIQELYHQMLRAYSDLVKQKRIASGSPIVSGAMKYLYTFYRQPITLKQVADELHISASHLSRAFIQETGMPLGKYLTQIRIHEAIFILNTTPDISITEAALLVGFSSYAKFSVAFKEEMGVSARDYLKGQNKNP